MHDGVGLREHRARARQLVLDRGELLVHHAAAHLLLRLLGDRLARRARRQRQQPGGHDLLAFFGVDVDDLAVFFQRFDLLLGLQHEALVDERRLGPRPVEPGDIHAELEKLDRDFLVCHARAVAGQME